MQNLPQPKNRHSDHQRSGKQPTTTTINPQATAINVEKISPNNNYNQQTP
jgi:hypothetical protein